MEDNDDQQVNSVKMIFMKNDWKEYIMHGIFVEDMKHIPTAKYLLEEFLEKYSWDFEITGGHHSGHQHLGSFNKLAGIQWGNPKFMESFIGLNVVQSLSKISLQLDAYI